MGTTWSSVITDSAMVFIDDVRLQEEAAVNPALFFRRMSFYVGLAVPMMNRPPELLCYLQTGMKTPTYDDAAWTSTEESTLEETNVETGKTGFSLFSCVQRIEDQVGNITVIPYNEATYDPETGVVTFPPQDSAGINYDIDFYEDGEFEKDLTTNQIRLLGMATACVWDERFSRNWLNIQAKIHDQSFTTVNESNYMREAISRTKTTRAMFNDELRKYEQDCAYSVSVMKNQRFV